MEENIRIIRARVSSLLYCLHFNSYTTAQNPSIYIPQTSCRGNQFLTSFHRDDDDDDDDDDDNIVQSCDQYELF